MDLEVEKYDRDIMRIHPDVLEMRSQTLLSQYFVTNWLLEYKDAAVTLGTYLLAINAMKTPIVVKYSCPDNKSAGSA